MKNLYCILTWIFAVMGILLDFDRRHRVSFARFFGSTKLG